MHNSRPTSPHRLIHRIGRFSLVVGTFLIAYTIFSPLLLLLNNQAESTLTIDDQTEQSDIAVNLVLSELSEEDALALRIESSAVYRFLPNSSMLDLICVPEFNIYANNFIAQPTSDSSFSTTYSKTFQINWIWNSGLEQLSLKRQYFINPADRYCTNLSSTDRATNTATSNTPQIITLNTFEPLYTVDKEIAPPIDPLMDAIEFEYERASFYFPFDKRETSFALSLNSEAISNGLTKTITTTKLIAPNIGLFLNDQNWTTDINMLNEFRSMSNGLPKNFAINIWPAYERINSTNSPAEPVVLESSIENTTETTYYEPTTRVNISQQRPLAQRMLTAVLLGSILIFILSLLWIQENSNFLEVAVGILLGLWGIQDVLIPSYITGPTLINTLILTFYVLLALVTVVRFAVVPVWRRLGPPVPPNEIIAEVPTQRPIAENQPIAQAPRSNNSLSVVTAVSAAVTAIIALLHFIRRRNV